MPGLTYGRKRLVKQRLDPMLKVKAVAHRTGGGRSKRFAPATLPLSPGDATACSVRFKTVQ